MANTTHHCPCCGHNIDRPNRFRVLKAKIRYVRTDKRKPLFLNGPSGFIEHFYDCGNNRKLLNYKKGFKGTKKKTICFKDGW